MDDRKKVYRAHFGVGVDSLTGYSTFCHYGHVTECGRYVDGGSVMWPLDDNWCESEAKALARLAPKLAEIGARLLTQASEILTAARE